MQHLLKPDDFSRHDESDDAQFYLTPRIVAHIDEKAQAIVTDIIRRYTQADTSILDLMSSCYSHLPVDIRYKEVIGLGMNKEELEVNTQLTSFVVQDLNKRPALPFADATFEAVLNTVSVQYLIQPIEVFREVSRVLKPGGVSIVSFSDRMFPTKAVRIWHEGDNEEHIALVRQYYVQAGGFQRVRIERHIAPSSTWFWRGHDPVFTVIGFRTA